MAIVKASPAGVVRRHALFREQAVEAYLSSMRESEVLRVAPPWSRGIMAVATVVVVLALAATFIVKVDQTGRGRGVLRVAGGVQAVSSQTTGVVLELGSRWGDVVPTGALLAKIDSTTTKAALLEAEREIARADQDVAAFVAHRDKEQAERITLLKQRAGLLQRRAQNQNASVVRLRGRLATFDKLQQGAEVHVELDQLPLGEFGSLLARVARISSDLATAAEVTEALGDTKLQGPTTAWSSTSKTARWSSDSTSSFGRGAS